MDEATKNGIKIAIYLYGAIGCVAVVSWKAALILLAILWICVAFGGIITEMERREKEEKAKSAPTPSQEAPQQR